MKLNIFLTLGIGFLLSCSSSRKTASPLNDGIFEMVFLQVNDVYEIAPIAGGREGGLARVATLKKTYKDSNENTLLVMAGDFLSPSVYNSLRYNGNRIRGRQMVESMNAAGVDIAVFGNHEFDINEEELQSRLNESEFEWISSNTFHQTSTGVKPFSRTDGTSFPTYKIYHLKDADGTEARIGIMGITLPFNRAEYVSYSDPMITARQVYEKIRDSCDAVVAITHQEVAEDIQLAKELPQLAVILGGHEHDMRFEKVGNVYITKAHANARSAYVVKLRLDKRKPGIEITPQIKFINESIALDPATSIVVDKWMKIAEDNYASLGFDAQKVIVSKGDSLDGREIFTRSRSTNLTDIIVKSMAEACPEADVVIMNGGSIRLDDILYPPITQFDILRSLPYGGSIREVDMRGSLLLQVLKTGLANITEGGFLHSYPTVYHADSASWKIREEIIEPGKLYRVAMSDFLLTGMEQNLDYLNEKNPAIEKVYPVEVSKDNPKTDLRLAIVQYLQKHSNN